MLSVMSLSVNCLQAFTEARVLAMIKGSFVRLFRDYERFELRTMFPCDTFSSADLPMRTSQARSDDSPQ